MDPRTKIATCCYCGAKTLLTLGGTSERHELVCASCSAPLHELKQIKAPQAAKRAPKVKTYHGKPKPRPEKRKGKKKKREDRPAFGWFAKKIFDEIEDIFD